MTRIAAYQRDPYLCELETEVVEVGNHEGRFFALLADTIFYPEGGGQPSDRGRVGSVAVAEVRHEDGELRHYLESPVSCGPVSLVLDWARRFDHMQQHTAQHLLTALAQDRFGWATTAFHLGQQTSDIELDAARLAADQLEALEEATAAEIRAARKVSVRRVQPHRLDQLKVRTRGLPAGHRGPVRLVEIEEVDVNTCGGTHVRSTAELESVKLLDTESMRGGTRLYFVAGGRLRRRLAGHEARAGEMRTLLGASDDELVDALKARIDNVQQSQHREKLMREELIEAATEALAHRPGELVEAHFKSGDPAFLQSLARRFHDMAHDKAALLTAGAEGDCFFVVVAGSHVIRDVQALGRQVAILLNGRGGGSGRIFQGKAPSLAKRRDALNLFMLELERD
jgi:alanyl-tRNA synthetase